MDTLKNKHGMYSNILVVGQPNMLIKAGLALQKRPECLYGIKNHHFHLYAGSDRMLINGLWDSGVVGTHEQFHATHDFSQVLRNEHKILLLLPHVEPSIEQDLAEHLVATGTDLIICNHHSEEQHKLYAFQFRKRNNIAGHINIMTAHLTLEEGFKAELDPSYHVQFPLVKRFFNVLNRTTTTIEKVES